MKRDAPRKLHTLVCFAGGLARRAVVRCVARRAYSPAQQWMLPCVLAAFLAFFGCGGKPDAAATTSASAAEKPAQCKVERGPVRVVLEAAPAKARLSDELTLTLTIEHDEGVSVEKPPFAGEIGSFLIRDVREPLPKINAGRETIRQIYTLEPTDVGRQTIDPIVVRFADRRPGGDGKEHSLETEPISVEIVSSLGNRSPSLADLHPPEGPRALVRAVSPWQWAFVAAAILAVAAAAWWRWKRRKQRAGSRAAARALSPEELANLELDRLIESGLATRDVKLFYVELTGIVRRFIERTTGIRAPEQTTEEFLREISRRSRSVRERSNSPSPSATLPKEEGSRLDECARLADFLEAADLVKFAAHRPRREDIDESIRRARAFIGTKSPNETDGKTTNSTPGTRAVA